MSSAPRKLLGIWRERENMRWWLGGAGFLLGMIYTGTAQLLGFEFRLGSRDFTLVVSLIIESTFAAFGFVIGLMLEARRRERRADRQVREHLERLDEIRVRLAQAEKLASLGQLASVIAHEVRNPLAIIRTMVQNLSETGSDQAKTCRPILEEIDRLSRVTSSLVEFARPISLNCLPIDAGEIVKRTQMLARRMLEEKGVSLQSIPPASPAALMIADPDLLCQVLLELLSNAADATPAGGEVRLQWNGSRGQVCFRVSDDGPGIPKELESRIFEPFFTTRPDGHGLGLAVARQIVAAHGGRIEIEDVSSGGAVFSVRLPTSGASSHD